ncbi:MAG: S8 family serine peptidase, partial [Halobacteriales archaeon]|nr:S8 family serine peptidase [Halobacteriales archaeon]
DRCGSYIPSQCSGPDINAMACFSSRGPAQQRIKPDVSAPGTDILSVESPDPDGSDGGWDEAWTGPDYAILPGTSMSTPITAGCTALIFEHHMSSFGSFPSPALGKALLINGANDMGFGYPSNDQGWGRVDCRQSIEGPAGGQIEFFDQGDVTHLSTGGTFSTTFQCFSNSPRLKVSLAWTDPPGSSGCDPCDINNLDLVVTSPGGTLYRGNQFTGSWSTPDPGSTTDTLNNVENVFVEIPEVGEWTVDVVGADVAVNPANLSGQDFALVYSGDCSTCTPPAVPANVTASATGTNEITVDWDASAGATEYRVYRSTTSGGPYSQIATVADPTTQYADTTVSGGTTYYYVVTAFATCESDFSNEASATATGDCNDPPSFAGLQSVSTLGGGQGCGLRLEWDAATSNCGGSEIVYNVYRSTSSGFTPDATS